MIDIVKVEAWQDINGNLHETKQGAMIASGSDELYRWLYSSEDNKNKFVKFTHVDISEKDLFKFLLKHIEDLSELMKPYVEELKDK